MTVGRTYTATRVRGMAPWRPQAKARDLVAQVLAVLEEYRDFLPMTNRQVFYRLVGNFGFPKSDSERLYETLNRARRCGMVPFDAIRTDGQTESVRSTFDSPDMFWATVNRAAETYTLDRQAGQPAFVEVWCEAAGMVPQLRRVCDDFTIPVYSSGGFDSTTVKYEAARRFCRRRVDTVVLHLGDYDASGWAVFDSLVDDVMSFCYDLDDRCPVSFERVVVTEEQIERYRLPTSPANGNDRRGGFTGGTVQAEALSPADLATELRTTIAAHVDAGIRAETLAQENAERVSIKRVVGQAIADSATPSEPEDGEPW